MQTVLIDLEKNPEIAQLVADKQPGDRLKLYVSIKALDEQTASLTIREVEADDSPDEDEDDEMEDETAGTTTLADDLDESVTA